MACSTNQQVSQQATSPYEPKPYVKLTNPEWSKNAAIYEMNVRHYTPEGTFAAAQQHLPRLKELGVDIIWLMPIHEIGEKNRKGTLGSPYSVRDYYSVNPEFGTLEDLKAFINAAHARDMYVILDWVANHTAWDNPLVEQHPDWYERSWDGDFRPTPWWDWSDIIDLDYSKAEVREYMTKAMKYWVEEVGVDGFRADVAGFVPVDFWNNLRRELDLVKPVFMLAEWESRDLHAEAFDMTYAWSWTEAMLQIMEGHAPLSKLYVYYSWNESAFPKQAMRMTHVTNHDMNAWEGTMFENFGEGLEAAIVLSVIGEGMPLIYSGQEAGNDRRLAFFEKDLIEWKPHPIGDLYQHLLALKKKHTALWNGKWGATMVHVPNTAPEQVLSFVREDENSRIFAAINFSAEPQQVSFTDGPFQGSYTETFSGESLEINPQTQVSIPAWGYKVFIMSKGR
ncbi:alpha-amylase family glycosyl hydrolase [Lacimicrobium alkaliphilum]|uniref:Alpha-amlyase n=1 Tax=Lacimicrobium alkaliphilum TaxID=1526571 RepID=A0A0U2ZD43_9ALTE|nr:alpha-amylase family glycosyl hydrolase [Lacimicrobium alkaliphilum]ALT00469.1 alpha-amlyase [Lacimicrobium alkaliphilum]